MNGNTCPLIFTHYGYSDYLPYTLACAARTNPALPRIFLGDELNRKIANQHGWRHYVAQDYRSPKLEKFQAVFRHIRGRAVGHEAEVWLRYVFARWYHVEDFVRRQQIPRFWHFDTDTMILENLQGYVDRLPYDFTTQCNGTCLNGLIRSEVVSEFNDHTIRLFENPEYIQSQEQYVSRHPGHFFNEMTSFDEYQKITGRRGVHLMGWSEEEVFDDHLRQDHGFAMHTMPTHDGKGCAVKKILKDQSGFFGFRKGKKIRFVSLNLSHCNKALFKWVLRSLRRERAEINEVRPSWFQRMLKKIRAFIQERIKKSGLARRTITHG